MDVGEKEVHAEYVLMVAALQYPAPLHVRGRSSRLELAQSGRKLHGKDPHFCDCEKNSMTVRRLISHTPVAALNCFRLKITTLSTVTLITIARRRG